MKLLHVLASPRLEGSNTLQISQSFLDALHESTPTTTVDTVDLFNTDLPAVAGANIEAKYQILVGQPIDRDHAESWTEIEREIERFRTADAYLITAPMWNFSVPYALKYYIDCIVQPGYLFRFNELGYPVPLLSGKKMIVVSSSGSDYSAASPAAGFNFHEPYLRAIFGFVGITDVTFVHAHALDVPGEARLVELQRAIDEARDLGASESWKASPTVAA
jgi:FMN-dependent NADH-azoreductase